MYDIENYYQRCVSLLAAQFQQMLPNGQSTNFQNLINALVSQAQVINSQELLLQNDRNLNTAQGVQLDGLGEIIGLKRISGQPDDSAFIDGIYVQGYRESLQFQVFINASNGTPEDVIQILKFLTNASIVWYTENYPAAYIMATDGLRFPTNPSDLVAIIQSASPAGVNFEAVIATYNTNPFVFSSDPVTSQFYVAPDPNNPLLFDPLQVNTGSSIDNFFVQAGETFNPNFGGGFAEALGEPPNFIGVDTTGAGQMAEAIQTNGDLPPS